MTTSPCPPPSGAVTTAPLIHRCRVCGVRHRWTELPLKGIEPFTGRYIEFRDCPCGNTLTEEVPETHD